MAPAGTVRERAVGEALWRFALAFYARPGVAGALMALQERAGRDVNLILFALWLGARGLRLDAAALEAAAAAIAPINTEAVGPLRRLRQQLKGTDDPDLASLRRRVLWLELAAERRVQYRLATEPAAPAGSEGAADRPDAAAANLAVYLGSEHRSPEAGVLLDALARLTRRG